MSIPVQMKKIAIEIHDSLSTTPAKNVPSVRQLRREWSERLTNYPGKSIIALAKDLIPLGPWERGVAYEIILHHKGAQEMLRPTDIDILGRGIQSWGDVDSFACYVAGPAWRERMISDRHVERWAKSSDHWRRRAALVSTVPLNNHARWGSGDVVRTLKICRMLVRDREDMVVKALSWALRELSKRNRPAVEAFLKRYDRELASRVNREVGNTLKTGLKNPRQHRRPV